MSTFAFLLPWVVGCCVVAALRGRHTNVLALLGSGFLMGQVLVVAGLYICLVFFGASDTRYIMLVLAALLLLVAIRASRAHARNDDSVLAEAPLSAPQTASIVVMGLMLVVKFVLMALAVWNSPIRSDDAISIWLFRAKVITTLDHMPLHPDSPFYMGGSNPTYPIFGSLLAAWMPLASGGWSERLTVISWPVLYLSIVLIAAGGLRKWLSPLASWLVAYLIGSIPIIAIHVVRPGYVDLPLAAFLAAAALHLLLWRSEGTFGDFAVGIIFALAAACMKREGPVLAGILIAGFLMTSAGTIRLATSRARLGILGMTLGAAVLCAMLLRWTDQGNALAQRGYFPDVWPALIRHCFQWSSFNIGFYALIAALICLTIHRNAAHGLTTWLIAMGMLGFVIGVFVLTPQARFALNDQTPSRLFLQIIPTLTLLLASSLARQQRLE